MKASVKKLQAFVGLLAGARVASYKDWKNWKDKPANEEEMARLFEYVREEGMPSITALVKPSFHPELPLILLNYTQVAHNVLHQFPSGWTQPLRLCRGIVFSRRRRLIAIPFPKFFNDEEMEETRNLPDLPFVATMKHDGHLGIIFEYQGNIVVTTRGSFVSRTSRLANEEMMPAIGTGWSSRFPKNLTVLVEIIHPETKVIVDYGTEKKFILIGAFNRSTLEDLDYGKLKKLAQHLGLSLTETWSGNSLADLRNLVSDRRYNNQEGFVVRFENGFRVKLKNAGYVGEMIKGKLTHRYIMQRLMSGSFDDRFSDLAGEIQAQANRLKKEVLACLKVEGGKKARWQYLYELFDEEERTAYTKGICRKFYAWLEEQQASS